MINFMFNLFEISIFYYYNPLFVVYLAFVNQKGCTIEPLQQQ